MALALGQRGAEEAMRAARWSHLPGQYRRGTILFWDVERQKKRCQKKSKSALKDPVINSPKGKGHEK